MGTTNEKGKVVSHALAEVDTKQAVPGSGNSANFRPTLITN